MKNKIATINAENEFYQRKKNIKKLTQERLLLDV